MGEKLRRIEPVKGEEPKQEIDKVAKGLKDFLDERGAFGDMKNLKGLSSDDIEERKILIIKEKLSDRKNVARFTDLLVTKEKWENDRRQKKDEIQKLLEEKSLLKTETEKKELERNLKGKKRMIGIADDFLKKSEEAMEEKLKELGLLSTDEATKKVNGKNLH